MNDMHAVHTFMLMLLTRQCHTYCLYFNLIRAVRSSVRLTVVFLARGHTIIMTIPNGNNDECRLTMKSIRHAALADAAVDQLGDLYLDSMRH